MSIKPKFSRQIFSGTKKYELRKTPIKNKSEKFVFVYESSPTKAIVGSFKINKILKNTPQAIWNAFKNEIGISQVEFFAYFKQKQWAYAIKITQPQEFKEHISLEELRELNESWRPPQSFCYLKNDSEVNSLIKNQLEPKPTLLSFT
ncbi:MAG: hypothetical protein ACTSRC_07275 [Candidatus Helarchaeota archaeon]